MATQQIIAAPAQAAMFLVLTVDEGAEESTRTFLADLPGITRGVAFRVPEDELLCVAGIGAELWGRLYATTPPKHLHPFRPIEGETHTAVATPGDLLLHLRARSFDLCFELARQVTRRLDGLATVVDEVHGFRYFDRRDLLGFVDGTENPDGAAADAAVRVDGEDDPEYSGGSYVVVQKYLHDLSAWQQLPVEQQESAIGRTKLEDVELSDDAKPSNSHVALTSVTDSEGNDLDIVRDNLPFGKVGDAEYGTYFIGYAADPGIIEQMLENMFIGDPPGNHDRILDFSTAVTGSLYFVPTEDFLDDQPSAPTQVDGAAPPDVLPDRGPDDSLGIGSLRGN